MTTAARRKRANMSPDELRRVREAEARRKRLERERGRRKEIALPARSIRLDDIEALTRAGRLSEDEALDPGKVADEVVEVFHEWAAYWLK